MQTGITVFLLGWGIIAFAAFLYFFIILLISFVYFVIVNKKKSTGIIISAFKKPLRKGCYK
jgi:hypothetical protein